MSLHIKGALGVVFFQNDTSQFNLTNTMFTDNTASDCSASTFNGNCSGIFSMCAGHTPVPNCYNCSDLNCEMYQHQTYCYYSPLKDQSVCRCYEPPTLPLSLVFIISICAIAVVGCIVMFAVCRATNLSKHKKDYTKVN